MKYPLIQYILLIVALVLNFIISRKNSKRDGRFSDGFKPGSMTFKGYVYTILLWGTFIGIWILAGW